VARDIEVHEWCSFEAVSSASETGVTAPSEALASTPPHVESRSTESTVMTERTLVMHNSRLTGPF